MAEGGDEGVVGDATAFREVVKSWAPILCFILVFQWRCPGPGGGV
jgi:hypothetical protein